MQRPKVNVAILSEKIVEFDLYGEFYSPNIKGIFSGKFKAEYEDGNVRLFTDKVSYPPQKEINLIPSDVESETFLLKNVTIGLEFHWEQKQNQRFLGELKIIIEKDKLTVINVVDVEHYLISVISSEMSATSSLELLKAHAIISRSWLLAQMEKRKIIQENTRKYKSYQITKDEIIKWYDREDHILYDVCADDHCQRYQGITKLFAHLAEDAVNETEGIVLIYEGNICDTRFSKSCGGITESFENVWENVKHPYLNSITDYKFEHDEYSTDLSFEKNAIKWIKNSPPAFCNTKNEKILDQVLNNYDRKTTDFYRWKIEYTQKEISETIKNKSGIDFGNIIDLIPIERGYSGRLIKLKIIGSKKSLIFGKELEIRKILSKTHLYSSAFVVEKENIVNGIPQKFILFGAGWGHGVGLCQIGAAVMGEQGYQFDEILLHYFRNAQIKRIY